MQDVGAAKELMCVRADVCPSRLCIDLALDLAKARRCLFNPISTNPNVDSRDHVNVLHSPSTQNQFICKPPCVWYFTLLKQHGLIFLKEEC